MSKPIGAEGRRIIGGQDKLTLIRAFREGRTTIFHFSRTERMEVLLSSLDPTKGLLEEMNIHHEFKFAGKDLATGALVRGEFNTKSCTGWLYSDVSAKAKS